VLGNKLRSALRAKQSFLGSECRDRRRQLDKRVDNICCS